MAAIQVKQLKVYYKTKEFLASDIFTVMSYIMILHRPGIIVGDAGFEIGHKSSVRCQYVTTSSLSTTS